MCIVYSVNSVYSVKIRGKNFHWRGAEVCLRYVHSDRLLC